MPEITHTARFAPADPVTRMLECIACPACGYLDPTGVYAVSPGNRVRYFCDGCGAFVTVLLSAAQADAVRRWSSAGSTQA